MVKATKKLMKFAVQHSGLHCSRVGVISECGGRVFENGILTTPMCLLYTQGGSVPHLTHEVLQLLTTEKLPLILPLPSTLLLKDSMMSFPNGIAKFVAMDGHPLYCSVQDPGVETRQGFNDKSSISVWGESGRVQLNVTSFMQLQERYKPCWFQALCDSDTTSGSSKKRISHSVTRSLQMLDECIEKKAQSTILASKSIFGSILGGFNLNARRFSAQETARRAVDGFVIEGFHINGPQCELMDFADIRPFVEEVVSILPSDKPRLLHGSFRPDFLIQAVQCGVDIFDSSFPFLATERGRALCFDYAFDDSKKNSVVSDEIQTDCNRLDIDLKDSSFSTDFKPLVEGCTCYTCRNFTRAYVNHLLLTSELLSSVLLMLHNLHHFLNFFAAIRKAISSDRLNLLKEKLCKIK